MNSLRGQVAVVTGAAQGLGYAIAKAYIAEGMKVALLDIRGDILQRVADEFTDFGGDVLPITVDLSDAADTQSAIDTVLEQVWKSARLDPQRRPADHPLHAGDHAGAMAARDQYHPGCGLHLEQSGLEADD